MPSTQKNSIIDKYKSYEEIASDFSANSIGSYCIEIYRVTINTPWDHYIMYNTDDGDASSSLEYNSNIKDFVLVWSKTSGEIAPFKHPNPKHFIQNQEKIRKQNEVLKNNSEINILDQAINQKEEELGRIESSISTYQKDLTRKINKEPLFFKKTHEKKIAKLKDILENQKSKCSDLKNEIYKLKRQLGDEKAKVLSTIN